MSVFPPNPFLTLCSLPHCLALPLCQEVVEGPPQALSRSLPGGKNPVSMLMEYSQRTGNPIEFINTGQEGPPHDPRYPSVYILIRDGVNSK